MKKILAAMSGGVDSAAACILLQRQGVTVGGGTMLLRPGGEEEAQMAADAAAQLGLTFHLFCWQEEFLKNVIEPFTRVYQQGGTPNPCIFCNRTMKFGRFLDAALELGYDGIATGHYAQVRFDTGSGRYLLLCAQDGAKDQTYMLYSLSQAQLARTRFPLGSMTKQEVRALAAEAGLHVAAKHDSQDICFVPDGDYGKFIEGYCERTGKEEEGGKFSPFEPGDFVTEDGKVLGHHKGIIHYTIGQRKGLGLS
ncbi:MAG: tRNA-specific 2-thiouridylase, partial [Oscillospiraceae bacterium]|nr:tRNA-specific 2-thiouridylase [Oscillospiraceae bacterium]